MILLLNTVFPADLFLKVDYEHNYRKDVRLGRLLYDSKFMTIKFFYESKCWSISWMCEQLEISRSAYYKWVHREIPEKESENVRLAALIKEYDERFNHILGYRRMTS